MPIYEFHCEKCHKEMDLVQSFNAETPMCCGVQMVRTPSFPAMVKIKGSGGYPSRRKFVGGSAPYTTNSTKAWLG